MVTRRLLLMHNIIKLLHGKTISKITGCKIGSELIKFTLTDGCVVIMTHPNICCEEVFIEDIVGDVSDIINARINIAVEVSSPDTKLTYDRELTWTYYKIDTIKGGITLKWCGTSNGQYSTKVYTYIDLEDNINDIRKKFYY